MQALREKHIERNSLSTLISQRREVERGDCAGWLEIVGYVVLVTRKQLNTLASVSCELPSEETASHARC